MYIFNHIPKTGGTSIYRFLQQILGDRLSSHLSLTEDVEYHLDARDYERCEIIFGHIGTVWNDIIGPNRRWMTILREPTDRVLSQYFYWRNVIPASPHLPHVHAAQTLSLEDFVCNREFMVLQGNQDLQTWSLADDFRRRYRRIRPSEALDVAKQKLSDRFVLVGAFEDLTAVARNLCSLLDTPVPQSLPFENRTTDRLSPKEVEPSVLDAIRDINILDLALYDFAKRWRDRSLLSKQPNAPTSPIQHPQQSEIPSEVQAMIVP